jgi:heme exporter protein C
MDRRSGLFALVLAASAFAFVGTLHLVFFAAPVEKTMGIVQKIFYVHVPSAYCMYLGATACLVGSIGYLLNGKEGADALAKAGAELAVLFGSVVLTTGPRRPGVITGPGTRASRPRC